MDGGTKSALFDAQRQGRPVEITDDAVAWIIDIACQRPANLGYAQELWTLKNLHSAYSDSCSRGRLPTFGNNNKTHGSKNTKKI